MSSGTSNAEKFERLWKVQTTVNKLIADGSRTPADLMLVLQRIIDAPLIAKYDFGTLVVPHTFRSDEWSSCFSKDEWNLDEPENVKKYPQHMKMLQPRKRFHVLGYTRIAHCGCEVVIDHLKRMGAVLLGAPGLALFVNENRESIKGHLGVIVSLDDEETLPRLDVYRRRLPRWSNGKLSSFYQGGIYPVDQEFTFLAFLPNDQDYRF